SGSLPLTKPASPPAPTVQSDALKPRVLRAGLYAGGVLVILLLLIVAYAALRGRRRSGQAEQVADWNPNPQPAYSPYGSGDPDRRDGMMEFFAAPASSAPAPATGPFPQFQPAHFQAGQAASAQVPAAGVLGASADGAGDGHRVGAWMPVGSGTRGHSKPAPVSGTPPWEPAAKPDSELPWAAPASPRRSTPRPAITAGQPAPGQAAPEPAWAVSAAGPAAPSPRSAAAPAATQAPAANPAGAAEPVASAPAAQGPPTAPSPTGLAWEDLTDSAMKAIRDTAPGSSTASGLPQRTAPVASRLRSPSGSDWDGPDVSESAGPADAAEPAGPQWDSADGDAYRPSPADTRAQEPGSGPRWRRSEPSEPRRSRSSSGTHRKTAGRGAESRAPRPREPSASDTGSFRVPASPDNAWPADDAGRGWESADSDNRRPSTSEAHWPLDDETNWPTAGHPPWLPAAPAAEPGDSGWPEPRPSAAEPAETWPTADSARWQPAGSEALWEPPAADREPGGEQADEDPFAWRPSASTETFPAIGEDS
ncbi:MAG: hypothetical protein ACRDRJ_35660, partial [Streptosporangiaceae bacterium]